MTVLARTTGNHLDHLPALWGTSPANPAVAERQRRSEEITAFQVEHDPDYAGELARLRSWVGDYEIPTINEDHL